MTLDTKYLRYLDELSSDDVALVGGKNASLGEMIRSLGEKGVRVPGGFATTAEAYRAFVRENGLEERIRGELRTLDDHSAPLEKVGTAIRRFFVKSPFPQRIAANIREAYGGLSSEHGTDEADVAVRSSGTVHAYRLKEKGTRLAEGLAIGDAVAASAVQIISDADEIDRFQEGAILVTGMTDPDWVPIMKKASGIITDHGGRTSHAAIVSRELNVPAVVGTGNATEALEDGREVTLSCAEGDKGFVYDGRLAYEEQEIDLNELPKVKTELMMNSASPAAAFRWWRLPVRVVGALRTVAHTEKELETSPRESEEMITTM